MSLNGPRHRRPASTPARFLAPLGLIAVVVVVIIIVVSAGGSSGGGAGPTVTSTTRSARHTRHGSRGVSTLRGSSSASGRTSTGSGTSAGSTTSARTYTVQAGDTFALISEKTGVPITTIEKLNPGVSSAALTIGQVIKLK